MAGCADGVPENWMPKVSPHPWHSETSLDAGGVGRHIGVPQPHTSSHSLGEPGGSDGFLWDIFFMRMTLSCPMQRMRVLARIKQALSPQPRDAFVLFNFSKAFSRYM